jgi:hypothetical protein
LSAGATPDELMAHARLRPSKNNTTVYRNRRNADQDLRDALNANLDAINDLPEGGDKFFRFDVGEWRQDYNSVEGAVAYEASWTQVSVHVYRLLDGGIYIHHFTPRLPGL